MIREGELKSFKFFFSQGLQLELWFCQNTTSVILALGVIRREIGKLMCALKRSETGLRQLFL